MSHVSDRTVTSVLTSHLKTQSTVKEVLREVHSERNLLQLQVTQ